MIYLFWRIKPILAGEFGMVRGDIKFAGGDKNKSSMVPSYIFLLDNNRDQIIVDTSFGSPQICEERIGLIIKRDKELKIILEEEGVVFEKISSIILTHLHWDHASNIGIFSQCPIYCQKKELEAAFNPNNGYDSYFLQDIVDAKNRIVLLDGFYQIRDGIEVVLLGGHTYGSQAVIISTLKGKVVIAGDNIMTYENVDKNVPIGLCVNPKEALAALEWVRSNNFKVLPTHDYKTMIKYKAFW
jgi:glyoxylase-like metal-dependent hydrolase (beta-lactamase superfamily II)